MDKATKLLERGRTQGGKKKLSWQLSVIQVALYTYAPDIILTICLKKTIFAYTLISLYFLGKIMQILTLGIGTYHIGGIIFMISITMISDI